jgi:hypothetical protein
MAAAGSISRSDKNKTSGHIKSAGIKEISGKEG